MSETRHKDYSESLLQTAELLTNQDDRLAFKNRAISTAYYAVFHTLQFFIARKSLGADIEENSEDFDEVFRLLEHNAFNRGGPSLSAASKDQTILKIFANCYELKELRHIADYGVPIRNVITLKDCKEKVALARETVQLIRELSQNDDKMRLLVLSLLQKNKRSPKIQPSEKK
jgi:hypothetical protein